jgi:hypothetical protein
MPSFPFQKNLKSSFVLAVISKSQPFAIPSSMPYFNLQCPFSILLLPLKPPISLFMMPTMSIQSHRLVVDISNAWLHTKVIIATLNQWNRGGLLHPKLVLISYSACLIRLIYRQVAGAMSRQEGTGIHKQENRTGIGTGPRRRWLPIGSFPSLGMK